MKESFIPTIHTPDALAEQVSTLPGNLLVVGSLGRSSLMGEQKSFVRKNGTVIDIDVVGVTGIERDVRIQTTRPFPLDSYLTNVVRPVDENNWGLFFAGQNDPVEIIDAEHCAPVSVALPWNPDAAITVLPTGLQAELIDITWPYRKNKEHAARFRSFSEDKRLPADIQAKFSTFRERNWDYESKHSKGVPLSTLGRLYHKTSRMYHATCPSVLQPVIYSLFANPMHKVRAKVIKGSSLQ